ncbi:MAG: MarR family winged helix-turn-helix transcriptional regulator [Oscillospiraceae bacterium]
MEDDKLNDALISAMEKIYHYESNFDVFYQGETKVLTFIARYQKNNDKNYLLPSDISKALNMTSPRVSVILNSLENKRYITRNFSTRDRRKVYIYITEEGKKYVNEITTQTKKIFNSMIEKLGKRDAQELVRIVDRLVKSDNNL